VSPALALARAGILVQVLERAPIIEEIGAGLQLAPNAGRVLHRLGVFDVVKRTAVLPRRAVMLDVTTGREIYSMDLGSAFVDRFGLPYTVMHRGDLLTALLQGCADTGFVEINPGREVVALEQDPDLVTAHCADGSSYSADVLVGADGLNSAVRKCVLDDKPPLMSRYVIYRGPGPRPAGVEDAVMLYTGDRHHLMQYPIHGGEMLNRVASFESTRGEPGSAEWGAPEELAERFAGACDYVCDAIREVDTSKRWGLFDREPAAGWSQGRVTLLGDAAHPMRQYLAQGAAQALEDALSLSACLASAAGEVAAALKTYESIRYPRVSAIQRNTRYFGQFTHIGGVAATVRDYMLSMLPNTDYRFLDWLYGEGGEPAPEAPSHLGLYASS